jgi:hypothetical protein
MEAKLHLTPRFSLNKLAEYMVATPRRRRRLIIDQIRPQTARVINYNDARHVIARFLCDPERSAKKLLEIASTLRDRAAQDPEEHGSQCMIASARALEAFAPFSERVRPNGVVVVAGPRQGADVYLSGVRIVVAPDVSLLERGTECRIGAIKLHFSRSAPLSHEALQYAATLVYKCLSDSGDSPTKSRCFNVDIFSQGIEIVPRAVKDRIKNLEAACEEIAERWPSLVDMLLAQGIGTDGD